MEKRHHEQPGDRYQSFFDNANVGYTQRTMNGQEDINHEATSCVFLKGRSPMQLDWNQLNQDGKLDKMLSTLPYPLDKDEVVTHMQQAGANSQMIAAIKQALPNQMFNQPEDIKIVMQREAQVRH